MVGAIGDQQVVMVGGEARNRWFEDREAHRDPSASTGCTWHVAPHDEWPHAPILADSADIVQASTPNQLGPGQPAGSLETRG